MHTHRVTRDEADTALGAFVRTALGVPWSTAKKLVYDGRVSINGTPVLDPGTRLVRGSTVEIEPDGPARRNGAGAIVLERSRLLHIDPHLVVIDKPPGINAVPFEPGERDTLFDRLAVALHRWHLAPATAPLFVVHRLDRETSGAMVFGRTWVAKRHLAGHFRRHDIEREYVALVHGFILDERTFDTVLLEDRGDGLRGSARGKVAAHVGRRAVTHVRPLAQLTADGMEATLVSCRLETGRQHQIRVHLYEAGHPLVGERVYIRGYTGTRLEAPRVMLHARALGFPHPARPEEAAMRFEAPVPEDFLAVAAALGLKGEVPR